MRFSLNTDTSRHFIKSRGPGWINVNEQQICCSVIVTPDQLVTDWPPQTFADLEEQHFEAIVALEPEIVLLGTGDRQRFPHPKLTRSLLAQGIGVEVMDTAAACRTYNIIMLEDRRVAAALLMID
ncbi:MAG TPA: Mth938-like domain-containing protein [Candidatus Competibacteraceae bacterium]|nr:Mth938-like domain-containing protein [Candidatus Competibacteraceae bacterium]MCP5134554.1 Mth938-like domain-containing protein [Gammaproteobacteria bacterium]HPF60312.1 Mth938-like domain-containing protein [Candidatus Competibacteraceae bacterium]HRY19739.1 Mth938-like domain-containing protein [Candidatus Competibacteraceae bacterium]